MYTYCRVNIYDLTVIYDMKYKSTILNVTSGLYKKCQVFLIKHYE